MNCKRLLICVLLAITLFAACYCLSKLETSEVETPAPVAVSETDKSEQIVITIKTPSDVENTIATGRHFKILGTLEGQIPEDAILRVSLFDCNGNEVRYAQTCHKGTDSVSTEAYKGDEIEVFSEDSKFEDVSYTAPEMVVKDVEHPEDSFRDATIKCIYTDEKFYALIVSATDVEHGLAEDDQYNLLDEYGNPYDALTEGKYTVSAVMTSNSGEVLGSAERSFTIGNNRGTIIHEITNRTVIEKGGNDLLFDWTVENDFGLLFDLLPGFFGEYYQMSTLPMSVGAETAEYMQGPIEVLLYNNTETSASYCLEMPRYMQLTHTVEDEELANYYVFDIGEPRIGEQTAQIVSIDDEQIHICRIDQVDGATENGIFITTEEQITSSDLNAEDGWSVSPDGYFAIAGVVRPYQLQDDELVQSPTIYSFYEYLNGPASLVYTFTPKEKPADIITVTKDMGIERKDTLDEKAHAKSVYEFYNVFDVAAFTTDSDYIVSVQMLDRNGNAVNGWYAEFELTWAA